MTRAVYDFAVHSAFLQIGKMIVRKINAGEVSHKDGSAILKEMREMLEEQRKKEAA